MTDAVQPNQFLRKVGLAVGNASQALDLSKLDLEFRVTQGDFAAPSTAIIRVFNPQPSTVNSIQTQYTSVSLQAGYEQGNFGVIFSGSIMQVKTGKLSNVDRYLDILAADGDLAHTFGFVNQSLKQPSAQDQANEIYKAFAAKGITVDKNANAALQPAPGAPLTATGGILPRGKVLHGFGRAVINAVTDTANSTWFIEQGVLKIIPLTGYAPGEFIDINSTTGMVGVPEATENGITVRMLLNPLIKVGSGINLNSGDIATTQVNAQGFPTYKSTSFFASLNPNGKYRVIIAEHSGGIRQNPWYTDVVCLSVDATQPPATAVLPYG